MNLSQMTPPPNLDTPYQDPERPNGVAGPEGAAPSWFQEAMNLITKAIFDVVHFSQHEYLDRRRLPHSIKMSEVLTMPHLLPTGEVIVQTVFPVASERSFVVYFTPVFEDGRDALTHQDDPDAKNPVRVVGYELFCYKEGAFTAAKNLVQILSPMVRQELIRQAFELKLRCVQFLYFTIMQPQHAEAYADPHGHLPKIQAARAAEIAQAAMQRVAQQAASDAGVRMPTPL
jgi:hypothetical protein